METLQLPATSYVILAMLTFREMSGYDLKFMMDKSVSHFYASPSHSQIYAEIRRLESHGFITMHQVVQEQRPDKWICRLTPAGEQVARQWLAEAKVEADTYKSAFQLRLFFGHLLPQERLMSLVSNQRRWLTESILTLEEREQDLRNHLEGPNPTQELLFPLLIVELKLATFRAELGWADHAVDVLKQWGTDQGS